MLLTFVLILNIKYVLSASNRSNVDIGILSEDWSKRHQDLKSQGMIDQGSLINEIISSIKSEIKNMKDQLYEDISNKIKEELIDVKSKQAKNINLLEYTRDGIFNLTSEVNSISRLSENIENHLNIEFSKDIKEDSNDLKSKQNYDINLVKMTSDGLSNLSSEIKSISILSYSATLDINQEMKKVIPECECSSGALVAVLPEYQGSEAKYEDTLTVVPMMILTPGELESLIRDVQHGNGEEADLKNPKKYESEEENDEEQDGVEGSGELASLITDMQYSYDEEADLDDLKVPKYYEYGEINDDELEQEPNHSGKLGYGPYGALYEYEPDDYEPDHSGELGSGSGRDYDFYWAGDRVV